MPVTVRNTDILFNDGTTQNTAAGAVTTTAVLNATAGASAGAVGTYAFLGKATQLGNLSGLQRTAGGTLAGSELSYAGPSGAAFFLSGTPAGTWRCMGFFNAFFTNGPYGPETIFSSTLWLRIS